MPINDIGNPISALSQREREVLAHVGAGHTYVRISRCMNLSVHTIDTYLRRIRSKTGVTNRAELVSLALQLKPCDSGRGANAQFGTGTS
ncbi:response regulator transcription factor [Nocardia sp. NPDC088792]|uniref:response regulator transcription factor n=1 Tax=Nocardia sp. NPDC088792 TaxID=3364332 RepID=UPI003820130E